jgi:hypothetical protein
MGIVPAENLLGLACDGPGLDSALETLIRMRKNPSGAPIFSCVT